MARNNEAHRRFVEETGDMMEEHGLSHMAGRVFGALQVCVPPHMSMDQLAEELRASKGSISMAARMLLRTGVIEKLSLAGHRRHYYRVRPGVWMSLFAQRTEHLHQHKELASLGLAALEGEPMEAKERLLEMMLFFDFVEEEMPRIAERWKTRYPELRKERMKEYGGDS
jgi:DNA-binding transcriptional regulator GbsR (MarR family)